MNDYESQNYKYSRIAAILFLILFNTIIITVVAIKALNTPNGAIEPISNTNSPYISQINLSKVNKKLNIILEAYFGLSQEDLNNVKAIIRENTFEFVLDENDNLDTAVFIIDLINPQLTYQVQYYTKGPEIYIECPPIELSQNQDVFCIGQDSQSTINANLDKYLPYYGNTSNNALFAVAHEYDKYSLPYLSITTNVCQDEKTEDGIKTAVRKWIKSKGIPNPDIIPTKTYYNCIKDQYLY